MQIIVGDLWAGEAGWRVVTTNLMVRGDGRAVMGAGVARQAADRHPELPRLYGRHLRRGAHGLVPITSDAWPHGILCLPTKRHWANPADMVLVDRSLHELALFAASRQHETIRMPVPAVGLGQADPVAVWQLMHRHLDTRPNIVVVRYSCHHGRNWAGS